MAKGTQTAHATRSPLEAATARSPLAGLVGPSSGEVFFEERPLIGKLSLRGDAGDSAFANAAAETLGVALPTEPMTFVETDRLRVHWIAYDTWSIWTAEGTEGALKDALETAFADVHHAVVDVSDYYTVIRVSGPKARALLAKGCPLDLHPRVFKPGMCAGSVFQHAGIFVAQVAAEDDGAATYDVQIRWSFAQYLWDYFTDGAREWRDGV